MGQDDSQQQSPLGTASSVLGIIGAALGITSVIAGMFKGCGQTCTLSSNEANNVGNMMTTNLQQYLAAPPSAATQQEALANFNQLWAALVNYCSQPSLGSAGQRCISDRAQGSCAYKTSPGGWQKQSDGTWKYNYPGPNKSGTTCWNYFVGFHDPIANDPRIAELAAAPAPVQPQAVTAPVANVLGTPAPSAQPGISAQPSVSAQPTISLQALPGWLLPAGLLAVGAVFLMSTGGNR